MKNLLKNRKALSTVVTTLIILVVSVLLAGVVTYFAINIVSTRVQQESLNLQYQHVWYSSTDQMAEVAIMVTNTGGRDVVFQSIAIRGQPVPTAQIFYFIPTKIADLPYISQTPDTLNVTSATNATAIPSTLGTGVFKSVTGPVTLSSGDTIAIYVAAVPPTTGATATAGWNPGSVTVNDVGLTIDISVFTAQASYIKETNVNAAP
jgi:hypothetical protein